MIPVHATFTAIAGRVVDTAQTLASLTIAAQRVPRVQIVTALALATAATDLQRVAPVTYLTAAHVKQRILTKSHIVPALVTPTALVGESILKPRTGCDALSPADKSAAPCCCGICCLHSLVHFNEGKSPPPKNMPLLLGGDQGCHQTHGSLGPPESTTRMASRLVQPFL